MNASWPLGAAWGVLLASPLVTAGRRSIATFRAGALRTDASLVRARARVFHRLRRAPLVQQLETRSGPVVRAVRRVVDRRRRRATDAELARELPVVIDLLGIAVGAGCTPYLAVDVAATWGPPRAASVFREVLRRSELGMSFDSSLDDAARTAARLRPLVEALLASDRLGAPVGPQLARLAAEERLALRRRAEAHARRVPVKLLFPLVFLVLPAFVLLTVGPGLVAGLQTV
jgi:tight adherence protein C